MKHVINRKAGWWVSATATLGLLMTTQWSWAQNQGNNEGGVPSPVGNNSMMAASPFTDFTIGAMIYMLLVGVLVATLLILGFVVVNMGLLSKRKQDQIGGREPSDVGVLKGSVWPPEPDRSPVLPAEEEESGLTAEGLSERPHRVFKFGKRPAA